MIFGEHLIMAASSNKFYIAFDYKNKRNTKGPSRNINIKMHQLFSQQRILDVRLTITQW